LCYHSISSDGWDFSVSKDEFSKQMRYLASRYTFVSLEDIKDYVKRRKEIKVPSVAITFDDGYKDILSVVPLLRSFGVKPTIFMISKLGNVNKAELGTDRKFLNSSDIKRLLKNGWEIGSHTRTHPNMDILTKTQIKEEILVSKKELEGQIKRKIVSIAFPKGRYNKFALKTVKDGGYELCLTMNDGIIDHNSDLLQLPRIGVDGTHSFSEFKVLASPLATLFRKMLKKNYHEKN
jgi:peptidoglycan/xylan/chitin deacetylase (PgdA/CDA1 family)